jgi:hypothetical protein
MGRLLSRLLLSNYGASSAVLLAIVWLLVSMFTWNCPHSSLCAIS